MVQQKLAPVYRLLHWGIALIVVLNAFVLEAGKLPHRYLGYLCVALVLLRLVVFRQRGVEHYNPKARVVYLGIWGAILGLGVTGFLMGLDRFWGNSTLQETHELIGNGLLVLSAVHLMGMFLDSVTHRRKTWMLMISGKKAE